jgi:tetratricopeptide (TPR) repeat protein
MLRRGSLKYINAPAPEFYDLARDPTESSNLHEVDPREPDLARELASRLSSADASASTRAAGVVDNEAEAKLRSLGYASGGTVRRSPGEGRGRDPKTATDYMRRYDRAVALFNSGDFALGVERLRELLPEAPENYMARFQIAIGLAAMKRWPESEEELSKVVRDAPEFAHGVLMLAEVQGQMGKTEEAIRNYGAASASVPWSPEPRAALARYLASVGRVNEAATAYEEAIRIDPHQKDFPRALLGLRLNHGEASRAVEEFRALASRFPASASLWTCLAVAQRRTGDTRGALDSLERALAIEPWRATSRVQLGETLLDAKAPDRAEEAFRRALQDDPERLQARLGLGRALLAQDRIADADAVLDAIVRERPRFAAAFTVRGQYWAARDDRGRAVEFFRRALRADPTSQEAWEGLRNLGETP